MPLIPVPALCLRRVLAAVLLGVWGCDTVGVKDAYTALDGDGDRKRSIFYTDTEAIYCVLELASGVEDVTVLGKLRAKRLFDPHGGDPIELDSIIGVEEQSPGVGADLSVSFLLKRPEGAAFYPAGEFSCELFVNGKREASLDFEIRYPECPFKPIENEASCTGLVLFDTECPGALGERCSCDAETGLWSCE